MRSTVSLLLYVAILWQAQSSAYTTQRIIDIEDPRHPDNNVDIEALPKGKVDIVDLPDSDGGDLVLEADMGSVLGALEVVLREQDELRQHVEQSQAQLMSLVKQLRQENSGLRQQLQVMQVEMSQELALGKAQGSYQAKQLKEVQQRMDKLEALLTNGPSTEAPSTPTPSTPPSSTPTSSTPPPTTTFTSLATSDDVYGPQQQFTVPPDPNLHDDSLISSVLVTCGGKLITGDQFQNVLKMSSLNSPADVEDVYSIDTPKSMLELEDGTIAVTAEFKHKIQILRVANGRLEHVRDITTEKTYFGIAQGPLNTLIVNNRPSGPREVTSLDIIDMNGNVVRTLLATARKDGRMIHPFSLQRYGEDVYISDWTSQRVFRVNVFSGDMSFIIGDLDLSDLDFEQPRAMDIDSDGNLYIATGGGVCRPRSWCVVQVSQSGSWRMMEDYIPQNGGQYPYGLEVTSSQIIISWGRWHYGWVSELTAYPLPEQQGRPNSTAHPDHQGNHTSCVFTLKRSESEGGSDTSSGLTNVALDKPALQSSYHPLYGHPEKAVDGSTAVNIRQCTHTADVDNNPNRWWRVDLMGLFEVDSVTITNRGDCCGDRLTNFDVYVVETLQDPSEQQHDRISLCLHYDQYIANGATVHLQCARSVVGQYVTLVLNTNQWPLHFCEIEVLGRPAPERDSTSPPPQNSSVPTTKVHITAHSPSTIPSTPSTSPSTSSTIPSTSSTHSVLRETTTEYEEYDWRHDEYYDSDDHPWM